MSQNNSSFAMAFRQPVVIFTILMAVFAGLFAAWWLAPVGLLLAMVMMLRMTNSPTAKLNDKIRQRATLTHEFEEKFHRIESYELRLYNAVSSASIKQQTVVRPILEKVTDLVGQVHNLCTQMSSLQSFYRQTSSTESKFELNQKKLAMKLKIETAVNEQERREYQEAYDALDERIDKIDEVDSYMTRVDNLLAGVEHTLNVVIAETIFLTGQSGHAARKKMDELLAMIDEEQQHLRDFRASAG